jgi:hypothetical protein
VAHAYQTGSLTSSSSPFFVSSPPSTSIGPEVQLDGDLTKAQRIQSLDTSETRTFSYGCLFLGADPLGSAWPRGRRVFSVDGVNRPSAVEGRTLGTYDYQRFDRIKWKTFFKVHPDPPEVLAVRIPQDPVLQLEWEGRFLDRPNHSKPKYLLVVERAGDVLRGNSLAYRARVRRLEKRGYEGVLKHVDAGSCGSPTWGSFFVTIFYLRTLGVNEDRALELIGNPELLSRGFQNCLLPVGVPRNLWTPKSWKPQDPKMPQRPNHIGDIRQQPVVDPLGPVLLDPEVRVLVPQGTRKLDPTEWVKIKGLPKSWRPGHKALRGVVESMGAHEWSALGDFISRLDRSSPPVPHPHDAPTNSASKPAPPTPPASPDPEWSWTAPDLGPDSAFYHRQIARLRALTAELAGPADWITDGEAALQKHRQNYGPDGPKHLVVLWWNWPREHWAELRDGASMNFLQTPEPGLVDNSAMTDTQLDTACTFVDELIDLGVLEEPAEPLQNSFPLFLVEKSVNDEWRCIADGKSGGQNDCCSSDPVHLGTPDDILPYLYRGGFSAVIDISKFFHMFPTVPSERKYMGLVHPRTDKHFCYATCPMGTRNSPGASGRFGNAFIRMLQEGCPEFQGTARRNDFLCHLAGEPFDPALGTGRVKFTTDGQPCCRVWIHVDDILLHGATTAAVTASLTYTMDLALELGLICQPAKTSPPAQTQKFCGFLYDTTDVPVRKVPANKVSRALALLSFIRREINGPLARLGLSVLTGVLQSLVPATPGNVGSNFLSALYTDLSQGMDPALRGHKSVYYDSVSLSGASLDEMDWWFSSLQSGLARKSQPSDANVFSLHFGDGSGTGTGGSGVFYNSPAPGDKESWMGTWTPSATAETSNWKELRTLVEVLRQEPLVTSRFRGHKVFYFTDNMVTYDVVRKGTSTSPRLRALVRELKRLEVLHGCQLEVIHVPGDVLIDEGADGLSRGVWNTTLQVPHRFPVAELFAPFQLDPLLIKWAYDQLGIAQPSKVRAFSDLDPWSRNDMLQRDCIWSVSPTTARQAFTTAALAWVESPLDSSHLFIVPRVMQRDFGRINRHIQYIGQFDPKTVPLQSHPCRVPLLIFYLPPHRRSLAPRPARRVDLPSFPRLPAWVARQVAHMRGL